MDVNKIRIITLGNMKGDGDLMLKPASKNEPEKIFVRKGSTTIFHKLADKVRGIKKAPDDVGNALNLISGNEAVENITYKFTASHRFIETPYPEGSINPENPIIFTEKKLNENEIDYIKFNNSFNSINYSGGKISSAKNNTSTLHSTDNIEPAAPNYIPLGIKQNRISNLKNAINFFDIKFDDIKFDDPSTEKNNKALNDQKRFVEMTINTIAHISTLKSSDRTPESKDYLSNLKDELKTEFQNLVKMARDIGYPLADWMVDKGNLDSALKSIDFIEENKSSWL